MCTVTYIPKEQGSFLLTQSRDESIKRAIAAPPLKRMIGGIKHYFPVDPVGMGTWIGISEQGRVASILNGGRSKHPYHPPYKHSRGVIILEYFRYASTMEFLHKFSFSGLEPFTLLTFEGGLIYEIVWNEKDVEVQEINPNKSFIYSSSSLYTENSKRKKKADFKFWVKRNKNTEQHDILDLHKQHLFENEGDKSIVPASHILKTVSITSVLSGPEMMNMDYFDLINGISFKKKLEVHDPVEQSAGLYQLPE